MASVTVIAVNVLNNPAKFEDPVAFEIQYEAIEDLEEDLEWAITWVGSPESEKDDQVLDQVFVGPVTRGQYKFVFEADAPNADKIPQDYLLGATVVFLSAKYRDKEFLRIGYYVNVEYEDDNLIENPPDPPQLDRLGRNILADQPRVTKWNMSVDGMAQAPEDPSSQVAPDVEVAPDTAAAVQESPLPNRDALQFQPGPVSTVPAPVFGDSIDVHD